MQEDVCYSTVVFRNGPPRSKEKNDDDEVIYSEVKPGQKKPDASEPIKTEAEAVKHSHTRLWCVCSMILCFLLVGSIITIVYISLEMNKQKTHLSDLTAENDQLTAVKRNLENQTADLSRKRDELNRTLEVIMTFSSFPVRDFCPDKKCRPCQTGWIQFQTKCYLFYDETPWKTWKQSREYCQDKTADLVVVDNQQEQEFLSNHTKYYYDSYHGFWLGLQETDKKWVWTDGRLDSLGFWIKGGLGNSGPYVLLIPGRIPTESWDTSDDWFKNKLICEREALRWSS